MDVTAARRCTRATARAKASSKRRPSPATCTSRASSPSSHIVSRRERSFSETCARLPSHPDVGNKESDDGVSFDEGRARRGAETMLRTKALLWWIPATVVAMVAVAEGGMHVGATRAVRHKTHAAATEACRARHVAVDLDGDGTPELVRMVRVGNEAWADVWAGTTLRSSTR